MAYSQHMRLPELDPMVLEEYVKATDDGKGNKEKEKKEQAARSLCQ